MAAATGRLTEVIRSPPAARKPIARAAGDTPLTAAAAPRSSETMTPPKCSSLPQDGPHHPRGEHREVLRVDPRVGGQGDHDEGHPRADGRLEGPQVGIARRGDGVGDSRAEVGVAGDPAQAGEVLGGRRHACLAHPARKAAPCAAAVPGSWPNSRRSMPIGAFCWSVPGGTTSMTGARLRLTPASRSCRPQARGLRLQGIRREPPLIQRGGDGRETGAPQRLDFPALLVRGHEEPDTGGGLGGRERLHGVRDGAGTSDPGVAGRPEQHRPEVVGP